MKLKPPLSALDPSALTGQLLIAMPTIRDPRFERSVIFMCGHTAEGAMGIVINRPLEAPSFDDVLRQLELTPLPAVRSLRLYAGGPVCDARGFVLHTTDWTGENSLRVSKGLAVTASLDVLRAVAEGGGPRDAIMALGYATWDEGQLDAEINDNAWLSAPADERIVLDSDDRTKWHRAMAKLKVDPVLLSHEAGHA